jgi:hypothetical protein
MIDYRTVTAQHVDKIPEHCVHQGPVAQRAVFLQSASPKGKNRVRLLHATAGLPYSNMTVFRGDSHTSFDLDVYNTIRAVAQEAYPIIDRSTVVETATWRTTAAADISFPQLPEAEKYRSIWRRRCRGPQDEM